MKIDKEKLKAYASLDDRALWDEIKRVGATHGFKLPDKPPASAELAKVRAALFESEKIKLGDALKVIDQYRKGV
jgi:hypothetical protein